MALRRGPSSGVNSSPDQTWSSGSTSSRTNASAQSSFAWNAGSVSKSHGMGASPRLSRWALLGGEALAGVEPDARPVQHRVLDDGHDELAVLLRASHALR